MALLLLLREYLGKRERGEKEREREGEGEGDQERGREERGREREESCTDMESHDYACHVTSEEIKSYNTVMCVMSLVDQLSYNSSYCGYNSWSMSVT